MLNSNSSAALLLSHLESSSTTTRSLKSLNCNNDCQHCNCNLACTPSDLTDGSYSTIGSSIGSSTHFLLDMTCNTIIDCSGAMSPCADDTHFDMGDFDRSDLSCQQWSGVTTHHHCIDNPSDDEASDGNNKIISNHGM